MPNNYIFVIPGKGFKDGISSTMNEMYNASMNDKVYPIASLFKYLSLGELNKTLQEKLIKRGSFSIENETWVNTGLPIRYPLRNISEEIHGVRLFIPREIKLEIITGLNGINKIEIYKDTLVLIEFTEQLPQPDMAREYQLSNINFNKGNVEYEFTEYRSEDNQNIRTVIFIVDIERELSANIEIRGIDKSTGAVKITPCQMCPCLCGPISKPPRPPISHKECPDPGGVIKLPIHAKIIYPTSLNRIQNSIVELNKILSIHNANIVAELKTVEALNYSEFYVVDTRPCTAGSPSEQQKNLYQFRNSVPDNQICTYWVESLIGPQGPLAGCASFGILNKPALVMAQVGSLYVLAHEIGHVLGLNHVENDDSNRLMYRIDNYTNPPPDLITLEVNRIRRGCYYE